MPSLIDCLKLPGTFICCVCNSVIVGAFFAYIIQGIRSGIWPWDNFWLFFRMEEDFWLIAVLSVVSLFVLAGCSVCILMKIRDRRIANHAKVYHRLGLDP